MSKLWRIQSLKVTNDKAEFSPSDIFYALNDLHHLTTMARKYMGEMNIPAEASDDFCMLHGIMKIVSDDVAMIREAASAFDGPRKWVQTEDLA